MPAPDAGGSCLEVAEKSTQKAKTSPSAQFFVINQERRFSKSVVRLRGRNPFLTEAVAPRTPLHAPSLPASTARSGRVARSHARSQL
jgi:hypothetical protein